MLFDMFLTVIYAHLDHGSNDVRLICFDFLSAFSTIQCHLFSYTSLEKKSNVPCGLWIIDYPTNRPQFVRTGADVKHETRCMNTAAPQGTVLSPFLFSLYIADRSSQNENTPIVEFVEGINVERVKGYKYLGITFDDKLSWKCHVDAVVKRVQSRLYFLRKLDQFL